MRAFPNSIALVLTSALCLSAQAQTPPPPAGTVEAPPTAPAPAPPAPPGATPSAPPSGTTPYSPPPGAQPAPDGGAVPSSPPGGYPPGAYPAGTYPPGAYPPPSYPSGYTPPPRLAYRDGQPIPPGYHLEERPRKGLVIAGSIVTGVPYMIGLMVTLSSGFPNKSAFLLIPWLGPWLTLGFREDRCPDEFDDVSCVSDGAVRSALTIDGLVQMAGGTMLLLGYVLPKSELVLDGYGMQRMQLLPGPVGSGNGLQLRGTF